jgi:sugar O-acyltransferase (sialic acid O-acetyltransferase NeuD family)
MKDIILIGGGGHCKSIIDSLIENKTFNIIGILDIKDKIDSYIDEVRIIGGDEDLEYYYKQGIQYAFISLGSIGKPNLRISLYEKAKKFGYKIPVIADKASIISKNAVLEEGTFIGKGAIINSGARIGKNCIINTGTIIEHDCTIEDFVHLGPGSVLSGGVTVGERTHVGTNSTIIQYKKIGRDTIIGAGSVVIENIMNGVKAYGNPCVERGRIND